jgi:hypothetical protein
MSYPTIFGDTLQGVPSPYVPHRHPYPTRYHGPIWNQPRFGRPYRAQPHYIASVSASPDGIGQMSLPSITRSAAADAIIGAAAGWLGAPDRDGALAYALGGAALAYLAGQLGLGLIVGLELWKAQEKGGLRPDLHGGRA